MPTFHHHPHTKRIETSQPKSHWKVQQETQKTCNKQVEIYSRLQVIQLLWQNQQQRRQRQQQVRFHDSQRWQDWRCTTNRHYHICQPTHFSQSLLTTHELLDRIATTKEVTARTNLTLLYSKFTKNLQWEHATTNSLLFLFFLVLSQNQLKTKFAWTLRYTHYILFYQGIHCSTRVKLESLT